MTTSAITQESEEPASERGLAFDPWEFEDRFEREELKYRGHVADMLGRAMEIGERRRLAHQKRRDALFLLVLSLPFIIGILHWICSK